MPPITTMLVVVLALVLLQIAHAQPFYINETRLLATASGAAPDLVSCRLPDDAIAGTGGLFPAQSAKSIWVWASLIEYPAYRPVTIQVVGMRSRHVVRAWDGHEFDAGVGCVAGAFNIGALRDRFGAEQLLAQIVIGDDLVVSIPFALVSQPVSVSRLLVAAAARPDDIACDFRAAARPTPMNVTETSVVYFCVDVDLVDRRRPASIQFEFRSGSAVVSSYRNDGVDLISTTTLFMPISVQQLMTSGSRSFTAQFRYDDRLMASQNFTLQAGASGGGGGVRLCTSDCSSTNSTT